MTPVDLKMVPQCANLKDVHFVDQNGQPIKKIMAAYKENKECARSDYYGIIDDMMFLDELYSNMADYMRKSKIKTYLHDNAVIKSMDSSTGQVKTEIPNSYDTSNIWIPDSNPNWQESEIKRDVIPIKERSSMRTRNDKINRWSETLSDISEIICMMINSQSFQESQTISVNTDIKADMFKPQFPEYEEIDIKDKVSLVIQKLNAGLMTKEDAWLELYPNHDPAEIKTKN